MMLNIPYTLTGLLYPIKDKKNNGNTCAVRRLFNLGLLKRIKRIDSTVMFICPKAYRNNMGNHISSRSNLSVRKASAVLNQHPMFISDGEGIASNGQSKYAVVIYGIVSEEDIVANLVTKLRNNTSLLYSFKKYPAFIRNQVLDALSDSPNIPHEILPKN